MALGFDGWSMEYRYFQMLQGAKFELKQVPNLIDLVWTTRPKRIQTGDEKYRTFDLTPSFPMVDYP